MLPNICMYLHTTLSRKKQVLAEERAKNSSTGATPSAEDIKSYSSESNHKAVLSYCTMEQGQSTQQVSFHLYVYIV